MSEDEPGLVGQGLSRREDAPLLRGAAEFVDDHSAPGAGHLAFVRSGHAHARVVGVDAGTVAARDDVRATFTWADVAGSDAPGRLPNATGPLDVDVPAHPLLADDRVRYHGQPVAAVVAADRYAAADAASAVTVEYEPLDAVTDPVAATADDAPTLFEAAPDNVAVTTESGDVEATERAFAAADRVVALELPNNRLLPTPVEPRAALARWDDAAGRLTVRSTVQNPHSQRGYLSGTLGLPERDVRVVAPHVGGGFGQKNTPYPAESMTAWAAMALDRPVRWTATRREHALAGNHGRDVHADAELAVDEDGTVRGMRVDTHSAVGAYNLGGAAAIAGNYGSLLAGQYDVPAMHCRTRVAFTTTAPVHTYRGGVKPEAIYVVERLVAAAARELGLDPADVRRRNQIAPDDFPHETPVGATYDSGDYGTAMDEALDAVDYGERSADDRTADGRYRGVGIGCYVESMAPFFESGVVRVHPDGGATVLVGTHSHGQGHATTFAQVVADELGVAYDDVDVVEGDTDRVPKGSGTWGSHSTVAGGNAVAESARTVAAKARRVAAHHLDCDPDAVAIENGEVRVDGDPDATCPFAEVAAAAYGPGLPDDLEPGLEATTFYEPDGTAYTFGTHVAVVAVDPETGAVGIERYVAVDDCGERVNPTIVEGQVHGGVAQGIGQARSEEAVYGGDGRLSTDSMLSYGVPRASDVPDVETRATVTPSPTNDLGAKGVGEVGTVAAPPTVVNAVLDALAPLGVEAVDMPLTDETVRTAVREATEDGF